MGSIKHLLKENSKYKISGTMWIECENERFFGPGRAELLQHIEATGSINKAAKAMKISYKKAWGMIAALNEQATKPMVISKTGGEEGGGSIITNEAKELIDFHKNLKDKFLSFLEKETNNMNQY